MNTGIDERTKRIIIGVIKTLLPDAKIYLFGSRARGTQSERSDIDIAVDTGRKLKRVQVGEARDMINESHILYKVDIVDFQNISEEMRQHINKEGVLWKD